MVERTAAFSKLEYFVQKTKDDDGVMIRYTLAQAIETVRLLAPSRADLEAALQLHRWERHPEIELWLQAKLAEPAA